MFDAGKSKQSEKLQHKLQMLQYFQHRAEARPLADEKCIEQCDIASDKCMQEADADSGRIQLCDDKYSECLQRCEGG
jgi:hypothetical protein